jgi:hypothetical protein
MDKITDGLKHDGDKPRLDLVPPEIIEAVGAVMTHGAEKYGEASYREVEPKRYRAALMRHICKWLKNPHGKDEDSGLPHLWHIACNVAFLCELDKPTSITMTEKGLKPILADSGNYICPFCHIKIERSSKYNSCKNCGVAIDWSGEE